MASVDTGSAGRLRLECSTSSNASGNYTDVSWALYWEERTSSPYTYNGGGIPAGVYINAIGTVWQGSFGFDWRPGGLQSQLLASGTNRVAHNPDGTPPNGLAMNGSVGNTGTSGGGSGATVTVNIAAPRLWTPMGDILNPRAARVSDTQISLAWDRNDPSNGHPTDTEIQVSVNNFGFVSKVHLGDTKSASVSAAPNQKLQYSIQHGNPAQPHGPVRYTGAVYTTPGTPSRVSASKNSDMDIVVTWQDNVAYQEHSHQVWHGTVSNGVVTWDNSNLDSVPNGTTSYKHTNPDPSKVHVYEVRAYGGGLFSAYSQSNTVQVLAAPNKPRIYQVGTNNDVAAALNVTWSHNSADTTPQAAYEFQRSTDGGSTWTGTGRVNSTVSRYTVPASTYSAGTQVTFRVRTWGSATTGGADGAGASPWSDLAQTTYKTAPTTSVSKPANGSTIPDSRLTVNIGFTQPEGATFVKASLELQDSGSLIETLDSTLQTGIAFESTLQNGHTYAIRARVQDSNGLWSGWASSTFSVKYLAPVAAVVDPEFLPDTGYGQVNISIADPGDGEAAVDTVTVVRTLDGVAEILVQDYPASSDLTLLDATPTVHGMNTYTVTTTSGEGAQTTVTAVMATAECRRAYLSKGTDFSDVVVFGANLSVEEDLGIAATTIAAAGRTLPIGLYGTGTTVQLKVSSLVYDGFGSSRDAIRAFLLVAGKACYRDPSGRRVFGSVQGGVGYKRTDRADLSFTLTETS